MGSGIFSQRAENGEKFIALLFQSRRCALARAYRRNISKNGRASQRADICHILSGKHEHGGHEHRRHGDIQRGVIYAPEQIYEHGYLPCFQIAFLRSARCAYAQLLKAAYEQGSGAGVSCKDTYVRWAHRAFAVFVVELSVL